MSTMPSADSPLSAFVTWLGGAGGITAASAAGILAALSADAQTSKQTDTGTTAGTSTLNGTTNQSGTSNQQGTSVQSGTSEQSGVSESQGVTQQEGVTQQQGVTSQEGLTSQEGITTQTTKNPEWYDTAVKNLVGKTDALATPDKYTGDLTSGRDPLLTASADYLKAGAGSAVMDPTELAKYTNPFIDAALKPQLDKISQDYLLDQNTRNAKAASLNAFGGSRQRLDEQIAQQNRDKAIMDATNIAKKEGYTQATALKQADLGRLSQAGTQALQTGVAGTAADVGDINRQYQAFLDSQKAGNDQLALQGNVLGSAKIGQTTEGQTSQIGSSNQFGTTSELGQTSQLGNTSQIGSTSQLGTTSQLGEISQIGQTSQLGSMQQLGSTSGTSDATRNLTGTDPNKLGAIANVLSAGVNMARA